MKTIFIIGAGFSRAFLAQYPVISDFLTPLKGKNSPYKKKFSFLQEILSAYSFLDDESSETPNIEIVLNFFESLNMGFGLRENLFDREQVCINAQKALLYLKDYIRERCGLSPDVETAEFRIYQKWIDHLQPDDSIISFNYDLLCDQLLVHLFSERNPEERSAVTFNGKRLPYLYFLLGSEHNEITDELFAKENFRDIEKIGQTFGDTMYCYLKLHGSVNWWCCSNTQCPKHYSIQCNGVKYDTRDKKFFSEFSDYRNSCQSCGSPMEVVILAPNLIKPFDRFPRLQVLWQKTGDAIKTAEHIVILGYSFSSTDLMTNFLFRINIPKQSPQKKWTIVNKDAESSAEVKTKLLTILPYREDVRQAATFENIPDWLDKNFRLSYQDS